MVPPTVESHEHASSTRPNSPDTGHSVGRPAEIPKVSIGRLALWLGVPFVLALLILVAYWALPALDSNTEDRDPPRQLSDSEQSRPE